MPWQFFFLSALALIMVGFALCMWFQPYRNQFRTEREESRRWRNYAWDLQAIMRRNGIEPPPIPKVEIRDMVDLFASGTPVTEIIRKERDGED